MVKQRTDRAEVTDNSILQNSAKLREVKVLNDPLQRHSLPLIKVAEYYCKFSPLPRYLPYTDNEFELANRLL
jgi:hypothetical protein